MSLSTQELYQQTQQSAIMSQQRERQARAAQERLKQQEQQTQQPKTQQQTDREVIEKKITETEAKLNQNNTRGLRDSLRKLQKRLELVNQGYSLPDSIKILARQEKPSGTGISNINVAYKVVRGGGVSYDPYLRDAQG